MVQTTNYLISGTGVVGGGISGIILI